jgi:hypothetical protein
VEIVAMEAEETDNRRFYTLEEFGRQTGHRKSRVAEMAGLGLIPTVKIGRRYLVPRRWVDELERAAIEHTTERANAV